MSIPKMKISLKIKTKLNFIKSHPDRRHHILLIDIRRFHRLILNVCENLLDHLTPLVVRQILDFHHQQHRDVCSDLIAAELEELNDLIFDLKLHIFS